MLIEVILEADGIEDVTELLTSNGVHYRSVRSVEAFKESFKDYTLEEVPLDISAGDKELTKTEIVKSFLKTSAEHIRTGRQYADSAELKRRLDICSKCEYLTDTKRCQICFCKVEKKAKWLVSKCDDNNW